jgi:hypothetical protein
MIKAILLLAIVAAVSAQTITGHCVALVNDNDLCDSVAAFPTKVCSYQSADPVNITSACNENGLQAWMDTCPKKNVDAQAFCNGEGYLFANTQNPALCGRFSTESCATDDDCTIVLPPTAAPTAPIEYCYECCTECFNTTQCDDKVANPPTFGVIYTNSTECTNCPAPPVATPTAEPTAATPTGGNPNTPTKTPTKSNSGAIVVASGIVLAIASALLL